ncbi:ABC transporter ATP-binding protein [Bradyrhizobium prioriisuperbiae]|uniref:ABC transporter ATP-binding protein n=1 Tax=Bradyrhizobium prioriisuperbiae TaxID=2854389 RepID=UPI0028EFCEA8|nr:ABC transporter ATP-binding protein [Bradyrhizobium prioritasuperba]
MSDISLTNIRKHHGDTAVLRGISLDIRDGEFLTLVGPSGCGKSTLLRIIAGLDLQDDGTVAIGSRGVDGLRPRDRDVAMVFQAYALYPHLSVFDNIALPLRVRRLSGLQRTPLIGALVAGRRAIENDIRREVEETAAVLDIGHLLARKPGQLSGGQRQRVALGRAMVRHPAVFLMDEPLSNLDAKLRVQMRAEITSLHRRLRNTFVFVTHDQAEAMTMSDRVAVMMGGELIQVGAPDDLYHDPQDLRVAEFIGSPKINVVPAAALARDMGIVSPEAAKLAFRPEATSLALPVAGVLSGPIETIENLGADIFLHVAVTVGGEALSVIVRVEPSARRFAIGEVVGVRPDPSRVLQFDAKGQRVRARELVAA